MKCKGEIEINYGTPYERSAMLAVMSVGKRIRALREAKRLDQGELAKSAGIAQSTLSDLESGRSQRPRGDSLVQLAAALDVDHDWLMTGQGVPTPRAQPDIDESHLLSIYRAMSDSNRAALIATARALLETQPAPSASGRIPGRGKYKHQ